MICKFLSGNSVALEEEEAEAEEEEEEEEEEEKDACSDITLVSVVVVTVTVLVVVWRVERGNNEGRGMVGDGVTAVAPNEMLVVEDEKLLVGWSVGTGIGIGTTRVLTVPVPIPIPAPPPTAVTDMLEWREDEDNVGDGDRTTDELTGTRVVLGWLETGSCWVPLSDPTESNNEELVGTAPDDDDDDDDEVKEEETLATAIDAASARVIVPGVDDLSADPPMNKDAPVPEIEESNRE